MSNPKKSYWEKKNKKRCLLIQKQTTPHCIISNVINSSVREDVSCTFPDLCLYSETLLEYLHMIYSSKHSYTDLSYADSSWSPSVQPLQTAVIRFNFFFLFFTSFKKYIRTYWNPNAIWNKDLTWWGRQFYTRSPQILDLWLILTHASDIITYEQPQKWPQKACYVPLTQLKGTNMGSQVSTGRWAWSYTS